MSQDTAVNAEGTPEIAVSMPVSMDEALALAERLSQSGKQRAAEALCHRIQIQLRACPAFSRDHSP